MTKPDGTLAYMSEPPSSMELEPLGGDIPKADPVIEDDGIDPRPLASYQWAGDVGGAEHGCELDGMPFPCTLLRELMYGNESHYLVGVRYQGDEHGAWGLSTFVRDIYKDDEGPDKTPVPDKGPITVEGATRYQYSIYSLLFAPKASSHGPSPDSGEGDSSSQHPTSCYTLNVGITNAATLSAQQLTTIANEISRIYSSAGVSVNFVNSSADYWLIINSKASPYHRSAVGVTGTDGAVVFNTGRAFVDALAESARMTVASRIAFDLRAESALAVGLGRAGAHEIGHFLLQQLDDQSYYKGPMHDAFGGGEWFYASPRALDLWKFSPSQSFLIRSKARVLRGCSINEWVQGPAGNEV